MDSSLPSTKSFTELLTSFYLQQHIQQPTHNRGHKLDLLISRNGDIAGVNNVTIVDGISDHSAILCEVNIPIRKANKQYLVTRNLKSIDVNELRQDIMITSLKEVCSTADTVQDDVSI